jgi:hypothetical protein
MLVRYAILVPGASNHTRREGLTVRAVRRPKRLHARLAAFVALANLLERRHLAGERLPRPWQPEETAKSAGVLHEIYMQAAKLFPSRHRVSAARRRVVANPETMRAAIASLAAHRRGPAKIGPHTVSRPLADGTQCVRLEGPFVALPGYPADAPPLFLEDVYRVAHASWWLLRGLAALAWTRTHPDPRRVDVQGANVSSLPGTVLTIDDDGRVLRNADPALDELARLLDGVEAARLRRCASCNLLFFADRKDKPACSPTCLATNRQRKWRARREERRRKAAFPDQFEFAPPRTALSRSRRRRGRPRKGGVGRAQ